MLPDCALIIVLLRLTETLDRSSFIYESWSCTFSFIDVLLTAGGILKMLSSSVVEKSLLLICEWSVIWIWNVNDLEFSVKSLKTFKSKSLSWSSIIPIIEYITHWIIFNRLAYALCFLRYWLMTNGMDSYLSTFYYLGIIVSIHNNNKAFIRTNDIWCVDRGCSLLNVIFIIMHWGGG